MDIKSVLLIAAASALLVVVILASANESGEACINWPMCSASE